MNTLTRHPLAVSQENHDIMSRDIKYVAMWVHRRVSPVLNLKDESSFQFSSDWKMYNWPLYSPAFRLYFKDHKVWDDDRGLFQPPETLLEEIFNSLGRLTDGVLREFPGLRGFYVSDAKFWNL